MSLARKRCRAVFLLVVFVHLTSCFPSFGRKVVVGKADGRALVVNLGPNRYVYSIVRSQQVPPPSANAKPVTQASAERKEIGIVTVKAESTGWGAAGLRTSPADFNGELGRAAARAGGTHYRVMSKNVHRYGYIVSKTVSVLVASHGATSQPPPKAGPKR